MRTAALLLLALALAGCPTTTPQEIGIYGTTSAPPFRAAQVTNEDTEHSVAIARGVALGISCWDSCDYTCKEPSFTVGNSDMLAVRPVYRQGSTNPAWVLLARSAGTTTLTVTSTCATQEYQVTVASPP